MAKENRLPTERINWFDGQRVTETDLDVEQIYVQKITSELALDAIGSGVVQPDPFETRVLLDTSKPGKYTDGDDENSSKLDIEGGTYDGMPIYFDRQVSDTTRGVRLEVELTDVDAKGLEKTRVLLLGRIFDGIDSEGVLTAEVLDFASNGKKISSYYFREIIAVYFNNFSGGTGATHYESSKESLDLISLNSGKAVVREAPPLWVYPTPSMSEQAQSPNFGLATFITSATSNTIEDEIEDGLGASNSVGDLYLDLEGREEIKLEADASTAIAYGQKFLAKCNNLQRIDLLLSAEEDESAALGEEYDWSGELVISIHELASDVNCPTDAVPDDLIDFDPDITPIIEVAFSQEDLEELGYSLGATPSMVSFNFAGTLIADPNIEPTIEEDKYYAFLLSRRGDNRTGTVILQKGFSTKAGKVEENVPLTVFEEYGKATSKFFEFDPVTKRYISDSDSSMWYVVHCDSIGVTDGTAYSDEGVAVTLQKTEEFIGGAEISFILKNIPLATVEEGESNYVVLSHVEEFTTPDVHPRTNNFVFKRIKDTLAVTVVDSAGLEELQEDTYPLLLARVKDKNVRDAQTITGTFDKPGFIDVTKVIIEDPSTTLLSANLIGRVIVPDTDCNCTARYRVVKAECLQVLAGDLDRDGEITQNDVLEMLDVVGNTINSEDTERSILGGEIDIIDFLAADLNADESVDGDDIELLEDAVDGYVNFTTEEKLTYLVLHLENILETQDYPEIYEDDASTGETTADTDSIEFTASDRAALIIRPGDLIEIESGSDSGTYVILTKTISSDNTTVTLTVENQDGTGVSFAGDTGFDVTLTSGTKVNVFADNTALAQIPFAESSYEISFVESPFSAEFLDICDLRRLVGLSFIEEKSSSCECEESACVDEDACDPIYKNQQYLSGDLYLPDGNILSAPDTAHRLDSEYSNIKITLPPGTIDDCAIDLYNTFIKAEDDGCKTSAGYPAMKYSDGTYVGCSDDGTDTDITKGRIKFSKAICSLYVDSLIDGYGLDGYADETDIGLGVESVAESFVDKSYTGFSDWTDDPGNNTSITNIDNPTGANEPAVFDITTSGDSGARYGRIVSPVDAQDFEGDFIVDFFATRTTWIDSDLSGGEVSAFTTLTITNTDSSVATLKLGWKLVGGNATKLFYSGVIEDATMTVLSTFEYQIDAPESVGDEVKFRLRRENDVVKAYYIVPGQLDGTDLSSFGGYVRLGTNPDMQPGKGTVLAEYEITQDNSPSAGKSFFVRLSEFKVLSAYSSDDEKTSVNIGRDEASDEIERGTFTFPVSVTSKTNIVEAFLKFESEVSGDFDDDFNVIGINVLNTDNLGEIFNLPLLDDADKIVTFSPGTLAVGDELAVDVTNIIVSFISTAGHLPGQLKGFMIEPDASADSTITVSNVATLEIGYEDVTTGVIFKVGTSLDMSTGIVTLNTRNILYDALVPENRTVLNFGVFLKKAGFMNSDIDVGIDDLNRIGIGTCTDETVLDEDDECFFITGDTGTGTFVQGPFPCNFHFPAS
jgi:hypothetical protein